MTAEGSGSAVGIAIVAHRGASGITGEDNTLRSFKRAIDLGCDFVETDARRTRDGRIVCFHDAAVREREVLRPEHPPLPGQRVYVCCDPGLESLGEAVSKGLAAARAHTVLETSADDESYAATSANRFDADLCLALRAGDAPGCRCAYFASGRFRSEAGYQIAARVQEELANVLRADPEPCGRTYAILRETRMPAVACEPVESGDIDGMRQLVARAGDISRAIVWGVQRGIEEPFES